MDDAGRVVVPDLRDAHHAVEHRRRDDRNITDPHVGTHEQQMQHAKEVVAGQKPNAIVPLEPLGEHGRVPVAR